MEKEELKNQLESIVAKTNLPAIKEELTSLEKNTYETTFWQDSKNAAEVMKKINDLKKINS